MHFRLFWTILVGMPSKKKTCRFKDIVPIRGGRGPAKPQLRKFLQLGHKFDGGGVQLYFQILNFKIILNFGAVRPDLAII